MESRKNPNLLMQISAHFEPAGLPAGFLARALITESCWASWLPRIGLNWLPRTRPNPSQQDSPMRGRSFQRESFRGRPFVPECSGFRVFLVGFSGWLVGFLALGAACAAWHIGRIKSGLVGYPRPPVSLKTVFFFGFGKSINKPQTTTKTA